MSDRLPGAPFDGRRFHNATPGTERGLRDVWRWMRTRSPAPWPDRVANVRSPLLPTRIEQGEIALTFINHATFLVQTTSAAFITDPVFANRASPVPFLGPKRVRPPGLALRDLPSLDFVLLSHNHYDHLDLGALRRLGVPVITTLGNRSYLSARRIERVTELDWWQGHAIDDGVTVTLTPAQHFSARTPFDRNRTLWGSFVVDVDGLRIFFAGDSGYATHFREIRDALGPPDLALLPIGAYEPRWFMQPAHMNPEEAVRAHRDLDAGVSVAMHFGCFQLTDEPFDEPSRALDVAREAMGVPRERFRVLEVGETEVLNFQLPTADARPTTKSLN